MILSDKYKRTLDTLYKNKKNKLNPDQKFDNLMSILENQDFLTIHVNLKLSFLYTKYCCICGISPTIKNLIELHHVRVIKKSGQEVTEFTEIMKSLNKKQIPVYRHCHQQIHKVLPDQMELLL